MRLYKISRYTLFLKVILRSYFLRFVYLRDKEKPMSLLKNQSVSVPNVIQISAVV